MVSSGGEAEVGQRRRRRTGEDFKGGGEGVVLGLRDILTGNVLTVDFLWCKFFVGNRRLEGMWG